MEIALYDANRSNNNGYSRLIDGRNRSIKGLENYHQSTRISNADENDIRPLNVCDNNYSGKDKINMI